MDELIERVEDAKKELNALADRDGINLSREGAKLQQPDTIAALQKLRTVRKEFLEFNDVYEKERAALVALGVLKPRSDQ